MISWASICLRRRRAEQILTAVRTSDLESAKTLVARGDFIALSSPFVFNEELRSGVFVEMNLNHSYCVALLGGHHPRSRPLSGGGGDHPGIEGGVRPDGGGPGMEAAKRPHEA